MSQRLMSDVEVVLKEEYAGRNGEAVEELRGLGMKVVDLDDNDGVVEGTIPAELVPKLKVCGCVAYLRKVFNYVASDEWTA